MSDENEKKFNIIINEQDEKIDLGKNFSSQYRLTLYDKNGEKIKQASKVNNETTAVLQVFIKNNDEKFPDSLNDFTYQLKLKIIKSIQIERAKFLLPPQLKKEKRF